ncbi:hypothetical protein AB0J83_03220 [Actinoplanes sp. NPDC049596]|uniref:hypothetical protein n=1 Tax=unclassified Actinoplanes TaxID=2626549 RepID=UPI00343F95DC
MTDQPDPAGDYMAWLASLTPAERDALDAFHAAARTNPANESSIAANVAAAEQWRQSLTGADREALALFDGSADITSVDTNSTGERRTPFWNDAAQYAAHPDYQRALDVIAVGLAPSSGVPVSDLAARVAAVGARQGASLDGTAGWASFAILSLGMEALLPLLDGSREGLSDADIQTLEDLAAWRAAMLRRDREEHGWP